ncbi:ribonuclease Z [compost metagenome]
MLVYTADTRYNEALLPWLQDADLLIAESSFYNGQDAGLYGHMTAAEAGRLAAAAGAKRLVLSHLPHFGEISILREEAAAVFSGEIILPEPGMQITI